MKQRHIGKLVRLPRYGLAKTGQREIIAFRRSEAQREPAPFRSMNLTPPQRRIPEG
jgi:hypothetical protein